MSKPIWAIPGHRVRLKPFEDNPEEFGTFQGDSGGDTGIVLLEEEFILDIMDDGVREVPYEQMEPA
jgi:hypothetical protein